MAREQSSYGKAGKLPISVLPRTNYTFHVKLLDDMSTWRGELKKMATNIARSFYNLQSCPSKGDPVAYVERAAAELVKKLMFLRDGFDENVSQCATVNTAGSFLQGKTKNFGHPALKHLIIDFFYTGTYRIAQQRADIFRHSIPFQCLALASAAVILSVLCLFAC